MKPFQNFKYVIDNSNYRNDWFDFKHKAIEQIVKSILKYKICKRILRNNFFR